MPKFKSETDEAQWCDRMIDFLTEDANFLQGKYAGAKWAEKKIANYRAIADYLSDRSSELDEDANEDEGKLDELDGEPPF